MVSLSIAIPSIWFSMLLAVFIYYYLKRKVQFRAISLFDCIVTLSPVFGLVCFCCCFSLPYIIILIRERTAWVCRIQAISL